MKSNNAKMKVEPEDIDIAKLNAQLRHGDAKKIAKRAGYSHQYTNRVLNPKDDIYNASIIYEAVKFIQERPKIELDPETANRLTKNGADSVPKSDNNNGTDKGTA